ncbi:hypothetical protein [Zavarzinella formosa]|uniref:hypothetical protein n=1 Tax=Zavarzinella formosa TaxID=360055 RepID=UPI000309E2A4|nr:hypothetical protein [Zavarzinella formosa]
MDEIRKTLATTLRSLIGASCERSLAANSIKIRLGCEQDSNGRAYFWIDPPWRLTRDDKLITGSADWPEWDGVEDMEANQPLWDEWSALFNPLNRTALFGVGIGSLFPDLRLDFESGHRIETFGNTNDGYWWYFRDRVTGEVFEAGASGIDHAYAKLAEV